MKLFDYICFESFIGNKLIKEKVLFIISIISVNLLIGMIVFFASIHINYLLVSIYPLLILFGGLFLLRVRFVKVLLASYQYQKSCKGLKINTEYKKLFSESKFKNGIPFKNDIIHYISNDSIEYVLNELNEYSSHQYNKNSTFLVLETNLDLKTLYKLLSYEVNDLSIPVIISTEKGIFYYCVRKNIIKSILEYLKISTFLRKLV